MIEHFPDLYPDEILYSACARFCDHVRYPYKIDVINELFGSEMACAIIDLPCHLRYFVDHLPYGHKYSFDSLLSRHTLLPFYAAFLPLERYESIRTQMLTGSGEGIDRRMGIHR